MTSYSQSEVETAIAGMGEALREHLAAAGVSKPLIVGIHTGGVWIAEALRKALGITQPIGTLNISFYRDDFSRIGINPQVQPSDLPFNLDDRHIILVDDVLQSGRTVRAALNELFDYGRPASVILAVLVERSDGRELPIQADVAGMRMDLKAGEQVKLSGPDALTLTVQHIDESN